MAIVKYTGNGGIVQMFEKLKELYTFKQVICEEEVPTETSTWQLWVSDEVWIRYRGGTGNCWSDLRTDLLTTGYIKAVSSGTEDTRTWSIVKTDSGVAFYLDNTSQQSAPVVISETVNSSGVKSVGLVGKDMHNDNNYRVYTDGLSDSQPNISLPGFLTHTTYTQLVNFVSPINDWYFPNVYYTICGQSDSERIIDIDGTKYFCRNRIVLKE